MILVSACLAGINCRYDGSNLLNYPLLTKLKEKGFIPLCPEQLGGLPTPRAAASIHSGTGACVLEGKARTIDTNGNDLTEAFLKGAHEGLKAAKLLNVKTAILKDNSPSCGVHFTSSGFQRIKGFGVFTALLRKERITLFSEFDF